MKLPTRNMLDAYVQPTLECTFPLIPSKLEHEKAKIWELFVLFFLKEEAWYKGFDMITALCVENLKSCLTLKVHICQINHMSQKDHRTPHPPIIK